MRESARATFESDLCDFYIFPDTAFSYAAVKQEVAPVFVSLIQIVLNNPQSVYARIAGGKHDRIAIIEITFPSFQKISGEGHPA